VLTLPRLSEKKRDHIVKIQVVVIAGMVEIVVVIQNNSVGECCVNTIIITKYFEYLIQLLINVFF